MESSGNKEYAEFEERVKRTVYADDIGPKAAEEVLRTAFEQFGTVLSVHFIPNYLKMGVPNCALVEMESSRQARDVVPEISDRPFMVVGMPRPVRGKMAEAEMFGDRPAKPGRRIQYRWAEPGDPDFETAQKMKELAKKHSAEVEALLQLQCDEEVKLALDQEKLLTTNYKKYAMPDSVVGDRSVDKLARYYGVDMGDD